mgnify:CR=1 FL=1
MICLSALVDTDRWAVRSDENVAVGDVFTKAVTFKPRKTLREFEEPSVVVQALPVVIKVVDIHYYGKFQPILGEGMTAVITLEGDGLEYLTNDSALMR